MPTSPAANSMQVPNPEAISTVEDLAIALRALRLGVPRSHIADDPLSLRDLSKISGIPRSTLSNAESGRVLPHAKVVHDIALTCGVSPDDVRAWITARHRVAGTLAHASRHSVKVEGPHTSPAASQRVETDEMVAIVTRLEAMDSASVKSLLPHLPAAAVGQYFARLRSPFAAHHLAGMGRGQAAEVLTYMSVNQVSECMGWMEPTAAQELLRLRGAVTSVEYLRQMPAMVAGSIVSAMPAESAAEILCRLPPEVLAGIVPSLLPQMKVGLLAGEHVPDELTVDLLFDLGFRETVVLLEETSSLERCAELVMAIPGDAAAGLMAALTPQRRRALLVEIGEERAGRILALATAETVANILKDLAPRLSAVLLTEVSVVVAASVLKKLPPGYQSDVLATMPASTAATVRYRSLLAMLGSTMAMDRAVTARPDGDGRPVRP